MGSSINTENELKELAIKLRNEADALEDAAHVLSVLREHDLHADEIKQAIKRAKEWA